MFARLRILGTRVEAVAFLGGFVFVVVPSTILLHAGFIGLLARAAAVGFSAMIA